MSRSEDVVKNFFAEYESLGIEGAYFKYMDPNCTWKINEFPTINGIEAIIKSLKNKNSVFKRPYAQINIKAMASDEKNENAILVEYEAFYFNKETGDFFKEVLASVLEIVNGKIIKKFDCLNYMPYHIGNAVPGFYQV